LPPCQPSFRVVRESPCLRRIQYIFTDKTGTLTCNALQFMKFCAGGQTYGTGCDGGDVGPRWSPRTT